MKEQEIFTVEVEGRKYEVCAFCDEQLPYESFFQVELNGKKVILHMTEEQQWEILKGEGAEGLVRLIGEAIEDHYD